MTLLFVDGFDHLAAADYGSAAPVKWELGSANVAPVMQPGRWGAGSGNCITWTNGGTAFAAGLRKNVAPATPTCIMGFAFRSSANAQSGLVGLMDSGATQCMLVWTNGILTVLRSTNVTLGTASIPLALNTWYWIEVRFFIDPAVGTIEVRVNGVTLIPPTPTNTRATANTSYNQIFLGNLAFASANYNTQFDDFFALDSAGTVNNNFLGERRIFTLYPTGQGATTALAIGGTTPAATNWQSVNQVTPDADVTYVTSATPGNEDTYVFGDLPANALTVNGVQFNPIVRKDDVALRTVAPVQRNAGGTEVAGTTSTDLTATYFDKSSVNELSLVSGVAWTPAEINGSQFGIRIVN